MRLLTPTLALVLVLWTVEPAQGSFFSAFTRSGSSNDEVANSKDPNIVACGVNLEACPASAPCCNNGSCQKTSSKACSVALGCEPNFSHSFLSTADDHDKGTKSEEKQKQQQQQPFVVDKDREQQQQQQQLLQEQEYRPLSDRDQSCFPLPVCKPLTQKFKYPNVPDKKGLHRTLIGREEFSGDPEQAFWTSDFDHLAPYAQVDPKARKLILKARRDEVKTQSGGGFGATVSSTRWNRYGTFAAKFKSGATGPGIVTAMMLSNPALGEEITFEITGRDPKTVITDFYRHAVHEARRKAGVLGSKDSTGGTGTNPRPATSHSWLPSFRSVVPALDGLRTRTRKLKDIILPSHDKESKRKDSDEKTTTKNVQQVDETVKEEDDDGSLEESHTLKKSATENELVYKIEWTPDRIQWSVDGQVLRTLTAKDLQERYGYGLPTHPMLLQLTIWDAGYSSETAAWAGGQTDYGENDEKEYKTVVDWIEISCLDRKEHKQNPWPGPDASKRLLEAEKQLKAEQEARDKEEKEKELERQAQEKKDNKDKDKDESSTITAAFSSKGWFGRGSSASQKEVQQKTEEEAVQVKSSFGWGSRTIAKDAIKAKDALKAKKIKDSGSGGHSFVDSIVSFFLRWLLTLVAIVGSVSFLTEPENHAEKERQRHAYYSAANDRVSVK